VKQVGFKPRVK